MPKQMTREERAAYMRDYRAQKRREAVAMGEIAAPRAQVDSSTVSTPMSTDVSTPSPPAPRKPAQLTLAQKVAAGLAAPDDDCAACGHDRQAYHLDGICRMPTGPRSRCGCPAFVDSAEPF